MEFKMKFWKKLVLFIITMIAIVLSCSRHYIVKSNFLHSIENSKNQNMKQHMLEKYMLESNMIKNIQLGEGISDENIVEYLESLYQYMENNSEFVAIYNEAYEKIYSNINEIDQVEIKEILNSQKEVYAIRQIGNKHYMLFSSNWSIDNKSIYIVNAYDVSELYEEQQRQMKDILIANILILVVSAIIISVFSTVLIRPIQKLNKMSKKIASGEFSGRVDISSNDEIGELAESFNKMAVEIENKINELHLQVKQKDDFINGFTHELKTPMTAIVGYTDLLRLKKCDEELFGKALYYIHSETKRLEMLSFKLMRLMALNDGKIEVKGFWITELEKKIQKAEEMMITDNTIEFRLEPAKIMGDSELIEVVLRNLIENANKAKPKDYKILVKGERLENENYKISVIDKGIGIPKEHIERVTEDFYMIDKARSRQEGGSGIGLSLVTKILNFHHSKLHIESEENVGTIVSFELKEAGRKCEE